MNRTLFIVLILKQLGLFCSLKILKMEVPTHKLVGESVKLICRFEMEGDTLYSVKWYRNEQEFYRFVPNDRPKLQIFPQDGIRVERSKSSRQHVFLYDLQLAASGTYRCEVSAEAPSFRTKHEEKMMVVVATPKNNTIVGLQPSYHVGDHVNVSCYSLGSSPPASLAWKVNDNKIYDESSRDLRPAVSVERVERTERTRFDQYQYQYDSEAASYTLVQPKVAEPQLVFGRIRDWFEKYEGRNSRLDTAASNLHFYVQEHHLHTGLKLECTAAIGPVYWHESTETSSVIDRQPDYTSWISSGTSGLSYNLFLFLLCSAVLLSHWSM